MAFMGRPFGASAYVAMTKPAKKALICGSIAFDTIMVFEDRFKNHILPDKVHMLNVAFTVLEMRREFGGARATSGTTSRCWAALR